MTNLPPQSASSVSLIVPCYNEQVGIELLYSKLTQLLGRLPAEMTLELVFVDDASTDHTWDKLNLVFGRQPNVRLVRHAQNQGIAGAVMTGIANASSPVCAVIDADCTYDPSIIPDMVGMLHGDVSMVTASPYHPDGIVVGVPEWRLWLSRAASGMYRRLMKNKLYCYTACVRVFHKQALENQSLWNTGFTGIPEMLWRVDKRGGVVVEYPAVLKTRMFGYSKMKVIPAIFNQLKLMFRIYTRRKCDF